MSNRRERTEPDQVKEVLSYFLRNPQAADNLEGVARWRLLDETVHHNVETTQRALSWLVSQGLLLEESTGASGRIFRLNPDKLAEAENFISGTKRPRLGLNNN